MNIYCKVINDVTKSCLDVNGFVLLGLGILVTFLIIAFISVFERY